ncbi:uncharacterized protein HD556DRAFT_1305030 [Suillus plorans]|uniref:Uncharacterized protein n=1 Tax=Suillus plorans TaxID=116603 RepID=A0A9P7J2Y6_9AGAM|nr:uncharacterized protein HD556DRAFT_1305030 [Suillus plorans]KAG1800241.1 hypothetical protein HD556DRAFT_1305030 [Suillus plorans]
MTSYLVGTQKTNIVLITHQPQRRKLGTIKYIFGTEHEVSVVHQEWLSKPAKARGRPRIILDGLTEEQATHSLASLWTLTNNTNKAVTNERQERLQELRQREEDKEEQRNQALQDEEEAACLEERKKISINAVKDPKVSPVTKDEHLTWEEFNEAAAHIINYMRAHDWPVEQVSMFIQYWWHLAISTGQTWSLEEINQDLLLEAHKELFNEQCEKQTVMAIQVQQFREVSGPGSRLRGEEMS